METKTEILIVEDSPTQAIKVQYFLEQRNFLVFIVHTGKEALDLLKIRKPAVIISDIVMPEMDGYEMCRILKGEVELRNIPVILLTGLSDPNDVIRGLSVGAEDYIIKPYNNDDLLSKIEKLINAPVKHEDDDEKGDIEIVFDGKKHNITSNRRQILQLLISTYENVIRQNSELSKAHLETEELNKELENKLKELEISQTELQLSEERFRILVQMMPDIVYRIDENGCFTFINNAVQFLGYLPNELIGKHFSVIMSDGDAKKVSATEILKKFAGVKTGEVEQPKLFDERRTGERTTKGLEISLKTKESKDFVSGVAETIDKDVVVVEINSSGMYESKNTAKESEFVGTVGVVRDITNRKLAEKAREELNEQLELKVKERTKALFTAKQDLEKTLEDLNISQQQVIQSEKLASLGTVIAGVTHELNNPLMSVLNYVQYVRNRISDEKLAGYLQKAENEVRRSSNIIGDLLSYSRSPEPELTPFNSKDVVSKSLELMEIDFQSKKIETIINIAEFVPEVMAKPDSLQQVILNLLINARDALIDSQDKKINVSISCEEENVKISVRDSGQGISPKNIIKIFDPFFTTKEPGKGTGLGLAVSRNIIAGFGGSLTCESINGKGATFIIKLPILKS